MAWYYNEYAARSKAQNRNNPGGSGFIETFARGSQGLPSYFVSAMTSPMELLIRARNL